MHIRYLFFAILTFIAAVSASAQTRDKLDKANGFKSIKLASPKTQWDDQVVKTKSGRYRYTGTCCRGAFSSSVDKIHLQFDSLSKLSGIYVSMSRFMSKSSINSYKKIIALNYGKEDRIVETKDEINYFWYTDKLILQLQAWENGDTWDGELKYTTPSQFNIDSTQRTSSRAQ